MTPDELADYLRDKLGGRLAATEVACGQLTATVQAEALPAVARLCKTDPALAFDFFDFMAGIDLGEEGFAVVTHLYSVRHRHHVTVRALVPGGRQRPRLPSITSIYRGADWHEREQWDMFGIEFEGHPGLAPRILTAENFEGWPLRKDFLLSSREAKPWPGAKEPKDQSEEPASARPAADGDAEARDRAERARAKATALRARRAAEREGAGQQAAAEAGDDHDHQGQSR